MAKRAEVDTSVLRRPEIIEYERLIRAASESGPLPNSTAKQLRTAAWVYCTVWAMSIVVAAVAGHAMYGATFSMGAAMFAAFTMGCMFGTVYEIQSGFAVDRFKKDRLRQADAFLESINYQKRLDHRLLAPSSSVRDDYDTPSWWVRGYDHSRHRGMFSRSDRVYMNEHGMDADTYVSNVLENDRD